MKSENNKNTKPISNFYIALIVIFILWIANWVLLKNLGETARGTYGDMFGVVNSLFSGMALAGIIYTILLQREELTLTRNEFITQNETLKFQRFENTFFNLVSIHHQIVNAIDTSKFVPKSGRPFLTSKEEPMELVTKGRDVFKEQFKYLISSIKHHKSTPLEEIYLKNYEVVQTDFGHYFRNYYRIIKLIDSMVFHSDEKKDFETKYHYTSIARAQLSDYELLWLFYNCLSSNGVEKFKPLVEKYALFKNLPKDKLMEVHEELYAKSAYGLERK
ncbi:MAG: putative phage abortive infection protein [Saprospiraceae bacterium]|jgi:hypothetical protein|nr:putative phage abortive infection protein [Saprospiraceae bacterium]